MTRGAMSGSAGSATKRPEQAVGICDTESPFDDPTCSLAKKGVKLHCGVSKRKNDKFRDSRERRNKRRLRKKKPLLKVRNKNWKDSHCKNLLFNVDPKSIKARAEEVMENVEQLRSDIKDIAADLGWDVVKDAAGRYGLRVVGKHVTASVLCAPGAIAGEVVCNGVMLVVDIIDGIWSIGSTGYEVWNAKDEIADALERINKARATATDMVGALDDEKKYEDLKKKMLEEAKEAVLEDQCLQARRCFLVPYSSKSEQGRYDADATSGKGTLGDLFSLDDSRGCCPGQTGHHLIQDSWLKRPGSLRGAGDLCPGSKGEKRYNIREAPVVCVEGVGHSDGSHGDIHTATEGALRKKLRETGGGFSMADAIAVAANAHHEMFGGATCPKACIKAQLRSYYRGLSCNPRPLDRLGREIDSETGDSSSNDFN